MAGENRKRRSHMYKGERPAINQVEQESTSTNEDTADGRMTGSSPATKARESSVASSTQHRRQKTSRRRKRVPEHNEADVQLIETSSSLAPFGSSCVIEDTECQPTQSQTTIPSTRTSDTSAAANSSTLPVFLQQDSDGDTFLHIAVVQGNQPLTEFLIREMQSWGIDIYNNLRQTPLHLAVITRQPYLVKKLVEGGADVNMMDRRGQTALHLACQNNDLDSVNAIRDIISSDSGKLKLELKNFEGFSVLHVAVLKGNKQLITAVLDMGANINDQDSNSGRTALHHAVEAGKCHVAEFLMSRGADVNKVTFAGNTALHTASGREMDDMAKLLLTHGASVNIANREGDTPKVVRTSEQAKRLFSSNPRSNKRRKR